MKASLPSYVNGVISSPWVNAGAMTNKGLEFTLNTVNINKNDFWWRSRLTISIYREMRLQSFTQRQQDFPVLSTVRLTPTRRWDSQ